MAALVRGRASRVCVPRAFVDDASRSARLRQTQPDRGDAVADALRFTAAESVSDPGALVAAYARHFNSIGGRVLDGKLERLSSVIWS